MLYSIVFLGCFLFLLFLLSYFEKFCLPNLISLSSMIISSMFEIPVLLFRFVIEANYICLRWSVQILEYWITSIYVSGIHFFLRSITLKWVAARLVPVHWQGGKDRKKGEGGDNWFDEHYVYWYNTLHTYCSNGTRYYIVHLNSSNGQLVKAEPSCDRRQAINNGIEARVKLYQAQTGGLTDSISVFLDSISNDANPWFVLQFIKEIICVVLLSITSIN
jgi:hypothetical protein